MSEAGLHFEKRVDVPVSAQRLFDWHEAPGAFARLQPPWQDLTVLEATGGIRDGARVRVRLRQFGIPQTMVFEHEGYEPGRRFVDRQVHGPFAQWRHEHRVEAVDADAARLVDAIDYALPGGRLGRRLGGGFAQRQLDAVFNYRHRITRQDLALHRRVEGALGGRSLTVAVSGASGLVGGALVPLLTTAGHRVIRLVRGEPKGPDKVRWSASQGAVDAAGLEGVDAVVHLAGEPIIGRWTAAKKRRIRDSRVNGTAALASTLAGLERKPAVLVSASAVGFYGGRGDVVLDEGAPGGSGFLAEVAQQWEAAAAPAAAAGIRVVHPRLGMVLDPRGGALGQMLPIFRLGLAGRLGNGRHWWSWVTLEDTALAIYEMVVSEQLHGPVNVVAPEPMTNRDFTRVMGLALGRPTVLPVPRLGLKLVLGEAADDVLLASHRVVPGVLSRHGFAFRLPELETAIRTLLGRPGAAS